MSKEDILRFAEDLKQDAELRGELTSTAAGIYSVVDFAKEKGYDIEAVEVRDYMLEQANRDLTDEQLDAIAGGKNKGQPETAPATISTVTSTSTVQTTSTTTTQTSTAETTVDITAETSVVIVLT